MSGQGDNASQALDRLANVALEVEGLHSRVIFDALATVRSALEQLREERDAAEEWLGNETRRRQAAEAEVQRYREGLRELEEDARQGKIHSESVRVDQDWPVHETIHRFSVIRGKARALLADSPDGANTEGGEA